MAASSRSDRQVRRSLSQTSLEGLPTVIAAQERAAARKSAQSTSTDDDEIPEDSARFKMLTRTSSIFFSVNKTGVVRKKVREWMTIDGLQTPLFGTSLEERYHFELQYMQHVAGKEMDAAQMDKSRWVPDFIREAVHYLTWTPISNATPKLLISTYSNKEDIALLREAINKCDVMVDIAESTNPLLIAHVFRDYLTELPTPLIPRELIPILQECMDMEEEEYQLASVASVINQLAPLSRNLLETLLSLLTQRMNLEDMAATKRMSQTGELPKVGRKLADVYAPIVFGLVKPDTIPSNSLGARLLSSVTSLAELQRLSLRELMDLEREQVHILSLIRRAQETVLERLPHSPSRAHTFSSSENPTQAPSASLRRRRLTSQVLSRSKTASSGSLSSSPDTASPLGGSRGSGGEELPRKHAQLSHEELLEFAVSFFHYFLLQGSNIFQMEHLNLRYERDFGEDGRVFVSAASPEKIVWKMLDTYCGDRDFFRLALLTFSYYYKPVELLTRLVAQYVPLGRARRKNYLHKRSLRILEVLLAWTQDQYDSLVLDTEFVDAITTFINSVPEADKNQMAYLSRCFIQKVSPFGRTQAYRVSKQAAARAKLTFDKTPLSILDVTPQDVARQITLLDHALLVQVTSKELLHKRFLESEQSPAFAKLVQQSNFWTSWGVSLVIQQECQDDQVAAIEFIIDVAKGCLNLNNFNSCGGLVGALSNPAVLKLPAAIANISSAHAQILAHMETVFSPEKNSANLRQHLNTADPPLMLSFVLIAKDLYSLEEASPTTTVNPLDGTNLINMHKLRKLYRLVQMVEDSKSVLYPFKHNYMIDLAIHAVQLFSEKDAYERAKILSLHVHKSPRSKGRRHGDNRSPDAASPSKLEKKRSRMRRTTSW
eukprot:CAMPEP_0177650948 /NCGR_PEP_ID=MMETSP0447-20121125/12246_1 /TAXON_ID=0 /ORGANISM="Stygamoeba regulata, Strain BSH-02190019" /LENGTH=886 /DNA_ID=CAMNT_0019153915 /DNA_START=171 /DNA_END=2828 /DNA_ORIENTATION=-